MHLIYCTSMPQLRSSFLPRMLSLFLCVFFIILDFIISPFSASYMPYHLHPDVCDLVLLFSSLVSGSHVLGELCTFLYLQLIALHTDSQQVFNVDGISNAIISSPNRLSVLLGSIDHIFRRSGFPSAF